MVSAPMDHGDDGDGSVARREAAAALAKAKALMDKLELAVKVQEATRAVNVGMRGAPRAYSTREDIFKHLDHMGKVFAAQSFLLRQIGPRQRRFDALRHRMRALQLAANEIVSFCASAHQLDGIFYRPPVLLIGNHATDRRARHTFSFKRLLELLSKTMIVIVCDEYRTTALCHFCGSGQQHPRKVNKQHHKGTVQCTDVHCPAGGRFKNRDGAAGCNIDGRFVYRFLVGGDLGGFSRSDAKLVNGQLFDANRRLSLFQTFFAPPVSGVARRWVFFCCASV